MDREVRVKVGLGFLSVLRFVGPKNFTKEIEIYKPNHIRYVSETAGGEPFKVEKDFLSYVRSGGYPSGD